MAVAVLAGAGVVVSSATAHGSSVKALETQQAKWSRVSCSFSHMRRNGGVVAARRPERRYQRRAFVVVKASGDGVETEVEAKTRGDVLPSDEWPENFSLLNFEDLIEHYEPALFKEEAQPGTYLANVMSKTIYAAFPGQTLSEIDHFFKDISGIPVVDEEYKVIGVFSRKDRSKAAEGEDPKVTDLMSSPAITLSADKTVQDAAVLMLKHKIHRIPVVNSSGQVVGMVTRTDIFTALDTEPKSS